MVKDPKLIEMTPDLEAKLEAVFGFMAEEYRRVGYVQRDEDCQTEYHRQRFATLLREAREKRGL